MIWSEDRCFAKHMGKMQGRSLKGGKREGEMERREHRTIIIAVRPDGSPQWL